MMMFMDTAIQISLGVIILICLLWAGARLIRFLGEEKEHLRHLKDDREAKEADYPD